MHRLRAFTVSFVAAYGVYTQYRAEFFLWMLAGVTPLIMMFVWISLAQSGATGETDATWFAAYFLVVYFTRQFSAIWLIRELDEQVRLGRLSGHLMHPINPYWRFLAGHCADMAVRAPIALVFVPIALWLSGGYEALSVEHLPFYVWTFVIGVLVHFHLEYLFGLTAFWTDQSLALEGFYFTLFYLLGGLVAPIEMFPDVLREVMLILPWAYIFGFPTEVALGAREGPELVEGLLIQSGWLVILVVLGQVAWRRGLRCYGAAGA